jgi:ActR/RegA family two-component response regulator
MIFPARFCRLPPGRWHLCPFNSAKFCQIGIRRQQEPPQNGLRTDGFTHVPSLFRQPPTGLPPQSLFPGNPNRASRPFLGVARRPLLPFRHAPHRSPPWCGRPAPEDILMTDIRVLLVDDETDFLETLLKRLHKRHLDAVGAISGEEAIATLGHAPFDVVVLDVRLPGIDGVETLRRIKQQHPLVEVILLTGHANMEVAVKGMELGAFDYLMKPVDLDDLLYKLQDAVAKKEIQEEKIRQIQEKMKQEPET